MSKMKISPTDDCIWFNEDYTLMIDGDTPKEAEVAAGKINNHGRMVEEIAELRKLVKLAFEEGVDEGFHVGDCDFEMSNALESLNSLTKLNQEGGE